MSTKGPALVRPGARRQTEESGELAEDLGSILAGELPLEFCFQPIVDLQRGSVAGYEVLVRFPLRSPLPPDVCFREAARFGLRLHLEHLATQRALAARKLLRPNTFLSVNLSPSYLHSEPWGELLRQQPDLAGVVIEITEGDAISDYGVTRERVAQIRAKGGLIAIDDAGAGYAGLKHILELRPNFIKLDRTLIQHCDRDRAKSTLIEMMGAAAGRMDAWIVAEGVETDAELTELLHLRVPLAQGYFLGRPLPSMDDPLPAALGTIRSSALHDGSPENLLTHAESCPTTLTRLEAEAILEGDPARHMVAVLDRWGRPVELVERHPSMGIRVLGEFMRCQVCSESGELLQRALTRPADLRFDPLAMIDNEGRHQGIVRLDRLMRGALKSTSGRR